MKKLFLAIAFVLSAACAQAVSTLPANAFHVTWNTSRAVVNKVCKGDDRCHVPCSDKGTCYYQCNVLTGKCMGQRG